MEYKKVGYKNKKHPAARLQRETMLFVVLYLRENQNMTFGQIGKEFSKSKQWARQILLLFIVGVIRKEKSYLANDFSCAISVLKS